MATRTYTFSKKERISELRAMAEEMAGVDQTLSPVMYQVAMETAQEIYEALQGDWDQSVAC